MPNTYLVADGNTYRTSGRVRIAAGGRVVLNNTEAALLIEQGVVEPLPAPKTAGVPAPADEPSGPLDDGTGPLSVRCPLCYAPPGEPCVTSSGAKRSDTHRARVA